MNGGFLAMFGELAIRRAKLAVHQCDVSKISCPEALNNKELLHVSCLTCVDRPLASRKQRAHVTCACELNLYEFELGSSINVHCFYSLYVDAKGRAM